MIDKRASGFLAAYDSACIISGISRFSFSVSVESITSLNDLGRTANIAPPVTVVALGGVMVIVVAVALT